MPVIILVADGARPDTLAAALDDGALPALDRLRREGALHTVTSVFPSVTGPAYTPLLMGRFPGAAGLPGIRWFDRARTAASFPDFARSYVGLELRHVDRDLDPGTPTLFELAGASLGALTPITRGLRPRSRVGRGLRWALRGARTHFSGDVRGWLDIDRDVARDAVRRIRDEPPDFAFVALLGIDKASHSAGHDAAVVRDALRIVDETAGAIRDALERSGRWEDTHLWVVSDHGHSSVRRHEDLAGLVRALGHGTIAHPWVYGAGRDVAVMVSGNAAAHLYLELRRRERPWWPAHAPRWEPLAEALLERDSVDLVLLPHGPGVCEVRARGRGSAFVECTDRRGAPLPPGAAPWGPCEARFVYRPHTGDPLALGGHAAGRPLDATDAWEATAGSDYPDALVQIARIAAAPRSGDVLLSAARDWDFRARYEPIPHVSSHGALHREHMLVPLLVNRPTARAPRRTADVMPSALAALGLPVPCGLDGERFV